MQRTVGKKAIADTKEDVFKPSCNSIGIIIAIENTNICIITIKMTPIVNVGYLNNLSSKIGSFNFNWRLPNKVNDSIPIARMIRIFNILILPTELIEYITPAKPMLDNKIDK